MAQPEVAQLLAAVTTNTTGTTYKAANSVTKTYQVIMTGTGTVTIEGSANGTDWYSITTFTASGKYEDNNARAYVRASTSGLTGATVTVLLDGQG